MTRSRSRHRFGRRSAREAFVRAAIVALAAGSLVVNTATLAAADVNTNFQLDGDVASSSTTPPDWQDLFTAGGQNGPTYLPVPTRNTTLLSDYGPGGFFRDFKPGSTADDSTFATGSKDTLDITPGWQCKKSNNVTDKGDIQNTYMTTFRGTNGHLIVYAALEKNAPNGNNNMAVWLLQDGTIGCAGGNGNTAFTGHHQDHDVLLVAAFLNGGSNPVINAYEWMNGALDTTALGTGGKCGTGATNLCAITNDTNQAHSVTTPWITDDKVLGTGHTLNADQFYEMGADLTALHLNECFANYLANTRSSQELGATLYDYAGGSAPTCGSLAVHKYIDVDKSGTNNTGDVSGQGWAFTVTGPSPSTTTICTGTTDASGDLVCSTGSLGNLTPGTYTVTETQQTGFYATDPGGGGTFNTAGSPSKTVDVTTSGGSVELGNTCFVDKTFRITGVPTGTASLTVSWTKSSGDGTASSGTVLLTDAGNTTLNDGIYQGVLSDTLAQDAVISWSWYITGDAAHSVTGSTSESLASGAYPTCAKTNTVSFPFATLNGTKYKDVNHDGTFNTGDLAGSGFTFQLKSGTTVLQTTTSNASGNYSFSNVAPGTYTVHESLANDPGWVQTEPAAGADRSVTVNLGDTSVTIGAFGNTPLSTISASFLAQAKNPGTTTDSTQASIVCKDAADQIIGSLSGNTRTATGLYIGTYTCTIVITDP